MTKISSNSKNSHYFNADFIRVLAILAIIYLHTTYNFSMRPDFFGTKLWFLLEPITILSKTGVLLFFSLSGYLILAREKSIKENWQRSLFRLALPLLFFSLINLIKDALKSELPIEENFQLFFNSQLLKIIRFHNSHLWFLVVLLPLYLLNPVWQSLLNLKNARSIWRYLLLISLIFSLSILPLSWLRQGKEIEILNNFSAWMAYLFFYLFGAALRHQNILNFSQKFYQRLLIAGIFLTIIGDYWTGYCTAINQPCSLYNYTSDFFFLNFPVVMMAVAIFSLLIKADFSSWSKNNYLKKLKEIIAWLSLHVFGIYLIHLYIVNIFDDLLSWTFNTAGLNVYLYIFLNYSLIFFLSLMLVILIKKIPGLRVIIGENFKKNKLSK